jgi:microcystin-dependent protein
MGFGGGGGGALPNHEHTNIALDGGPLDFSNVTIASLLAGSITYSDGNALQELTIGGAGDQLQVSAGLPSWVSASAAHESGMIAVWAGTNGNIPTGWLLCDGSSVATATYPDLFTALGYAYGGAGANFNLPNLVDVFVRGQSTQTATTGGSNSLTLSTAQMPSHTHVVTDPGHAHYGPRRNGSGGSVGMNDSSGSPGLTAPPALLTSSDTTGISLATAGSSSGFDNQPAFLEMQYIIKT